MTRVPSAPGLPRYGGKHDHPAVVTPSAKVAYRRSLGQLEGFEAPDAIVICYQHTAHEHLLRVHGLPADPPTRSYRGVRSIPGTGGRVGLLAGFGFGAPAVALLIEDFIALGTRRFVSVGTAGSLNPELHPIGSVVILDEAVRDEGVSHHYLASDKPARPSPELVAELSRELVCRDIAHAVRPTWTIDAPYRETHPECMWYRRRGVACVEMEAAAIYAVASYRSVDAVCAAVISDAVTDGTWTLQSHERVVLDRLRAVCDAAVAIAARTVPTSGPCPRPRSSSAFADVIASMDQFRARHGGVGKRAVR